MELKKPEKAFLKKMITARVVFLIILVVCAVLIAVNESIVVLLAASVMFGILILMQLFYTAIFSKMQFNGLSYFYDDKKIIINKGVIFKSHNEIPVIQVQDITVLIGPIESIFKIATVRISTGGSNSILYGLSIEDANKMANSIRENITKRIEQYGK